jgi:hypothetical protein
MMDDQAKPAATSRSLPFQHLEIAVGISKGRDRSRADVLVDTDRLSWAIECSHPDWANRRTGVRRLMWRRD